MPRRVLGMGTLPELIMLTLERARELFSYDPEEGVLRWRITSRRARAGHPAGSPNSKGYIRVKVDGRQYQAHNIAWFLTHGEWPTSILDHKNLVKDCNRMDNLRPATHSQNQANQPLAVGASRHGPRWRAQIQKHRKRITIGYFDTQEEAAAAYAEAHRDAWGDFSPAARPDLRAD